MRKRDHKAEYARRKQRAREVEMVAEFEFHQLNLRIENEVAADTLLLKRIGWIAGFIFFAVLAAGSQPIELAYGLM